MKNEAQIKNVNRMNMTLKAENSELISKCQILNTNLNDREKDSGEKIS